MAAMNRRLSGMTTVFLHPDPDTAWISSTFVRDAVDKNLIAEIREVVPAPVAEALAGGQWPVIRDGRPVWDQAAQQSARAQAARARARGTISSEPGSQASDSHLLTSRRVSARAASWRDSQELPSLR